MINWAYFPKSTRAVPLALQVVSAFKEGAPRIDSSIHQLASNAVLAEIASGLVDAGFVVETGKRLDQKIIRTEIHQAQVNFRERFWPRPGAAMWHALQSVYGFHTNRANVFRQCDPVALYHS